MPQLFSALRVLGHHTVMKSALGFRKEGRQRSGLFAEIAVLAALKENGCTVLISEPRAADGFNLAQYPGYRERGHKSYTRMFEYFDRGQLEKFSKVADRRKRESDQKEINEEKKKNPETKKRPTRGGGDPDLFVIRNDGTWFFVEVKDKGDQVRTKQGVVFPLIRSILECEVWLAQFECVPGAKPYASARHAAFQAGMSRVQALTGRAVDTLWQR